MSVCISQKLSNIVEKGEKIIKTTDNCTKLLTDDDNVPPNDDNDDDDDQVRIAVCKQRTVYHTMSNKPVPWA